MAAVLTMKLQPAAQIEKAVQRFRAQRRATTPSMAVAMMVSLLHMVLTMKAAAVIRPMVAAQTAEHSLKAQIMKVVQRPIRALTACMAAAVTDEPKPEGPTLKVANSIQEVSFVNLCLVCALLLDDVES